MVSKKYDAIEKLEMKGVKVHKLQKKEDKRGWVLKMIMNKDIKENKEFGEIYITTAYPGAIKGGHYHEYCTEWFCVIKGEGKLVLLNKKSNEKEEIMMGDNNMVVVEVPFDIIHAIKNVGKDMMYLVVYADKEYNSVNPDTIP